MLSKMENAVGVASCLALFAMMLVTVVDVVGRQVFNHPLAGGTEITEVALVVITFLVYPVIAYRQRHIAIDIVDPFLSERMRRVQQIAVGLCGAFIFALLGWRLWVLGDRSASYGDTTAYLLIPVAPIFWFMSVMSVLTALAFAVLIFMPPKPLESPEAKALLGAQ